MGYVWTGTLLFPIKYLRTYVQSSPMLHAVITVTLYGFSGKIYFQYISQYKWRRVSKNFYFCKCFTNFLDNSPIVPLWCPPMFSRVFPLFHGRFPWFLRSSIRFSKIINFFQTINQSFLDQTFIQRNFHRWLNWLLLAWSQNWQITTIIIHDVPSTSFSGSCTCCLGHPLLAHLIIY